MLSGNVLITGGTGSLGTAILDRAARENWPAQFTVLARNETKIVQSRQKFPNVRCEIGDIREYSRLVSVFRNQNTIIHAAAIKIVPEAEASPSEAVRTNVTGSMNVIQAAIDAGVEKVIGVSTDKACQPTNTYGHTKSIMESLFREAANKSYTKFFLCRYGNVIGSANSIFPLLKQQKEEGKSFTVTDARCTRFWLTMKDAIDLILLTNEQQEQAAIIIPKAPASKVTDLFSAFDENWPVIDIGIRPGEKIHEQLVGNAESRHTLDRGRYFIVHPASSGIEGNLPDDYGYYSNAPDCQLTLDELREMLGA